MYEATDDIDGVVGSFTEDEDIYHEAVPSPVGPLKNLAQMRAYYEMLFPSVKGESVTPIRRLSAMTSWSTRHSGRERSPTGIGAFATA